MNLIRWNPFRDMSVLQQQMNRMFDNTLHGWPAEDGATAWFPAADVYETENDLVLRADIPGVDPKQIDIRVENNVLTIRGERSLDSNKVKEENFHRVERLYGTFARSFTLSTTVDADKIKANYKDGVLTITLPKAEAAKPKRIQIAAVG
jgi:HSP20 family protein